MKLTPIWRKTVRSSTRITVLKDIRIKGVTDEISEKEVERDTTVYTIEGIDPEVAYLEGSGESFSLISNVKHLHPYFVRPDFFELVKSFDPFQMEWQGLRETRDNKGHFPHLVPPKDLSEVVLKQQEVPDSWELVLLNDWNHTLWDKNLDVLPFGKCFNYIDSPFSNEHVRLSEEFLEFLRNHPWVTNKDEIRLERIPHYNASADLSLFVRVRICPDVESFRETFRVKGWKNWSELNGSNLLHAEDRSKVKDWFGIGPWLL